jgi:hypothetical protein
MLRRVSEVFTMGDLRIGVDLEKEYSTLLEDPRALSKIDPRR